MSDPLGVEDMLRSFSALWEKTARLWLREVGYANIASGDFRDASMPHETNPIILLIVIVAALFAYLSYGIPF